MVTRVGTERNDTLRGGVGDDILRGLGGDDRLIGLGGHDQIEGGAGDDTLDGGAGSDYLVGGSGSDTLFGGDERDRLLLDHGGADRADGGGGDDYIILDGFSGAKGRADIDGGAGDDQFGVMPTGDGAATITLTGAPGAPGGSATLSVDGAVRARISDIETVYIKTGAGDDRVTTGAGAQWLDLGKGANTAKTGGGDDNVALYLDGERDVINLGKGFDRLTYYERDPSQASLVMSRDGEALVFSIGGVESARVSGADDLDIRTAAGNNGALKSDDVLLGGAGDDLFIAGGASDRIDAGAGADDVQLLFDGLRDVVEGGDGRDRLVLSPTEQSGAVVMTVDGTSISVTQAGRSVVQASGFETIYARGGRDNDVLVGLNGDDEFYSYTGVDTINGGGGRDTAHFTNEATGVSVTLIAGQSVRAIAGGAVGDLLTSIENLEGTSFADTLIGDQGDNVISGGSNSTSRIVDFLDGRGGVDTYLNDLNSRVDRIDLAGDRNVRNFENAIGNRHDETFVGNDKANRLEGGGGYDSMTGGAGADVFAFTGVYETLIEQAPAGARAGIRDFSSRQGDRIDLRELFTVGDFEVDLTYRGAKAYSGAGAEVRVTESGGNSFVRVDLDGDRIDDFVIGLKDASGLGRDDFLL